VGHRLFHVVNKRNLNLALLQSSYRISAKNKSKTSNNLAGNVPLSSWHFYCCFFLNPITVRPLTLKLLIERGNYRAGCLEFRYPEMTLYRKTESVMPLSDPHLSHKLLRLAALPDYQDMTYNTLHNLPKRRNRKIPDHIFI